jgi:hypothetical protein
METKFNSNQYWNDRYNSGKHSGLGSYGKLATYKADFINQFIIDNNIKSLSELGCGDGNNLSMIKCEKIIGYDVASNAIDRCKKLMPFNTFQLLPCDILQQTDLVLSLDVIYHLVEDDVYNDYIFKMCQMSSKYIIVYSANFDSNDFAIHVKPRKFTEHPILLNDYKLIKIEKNKYPSQIDTQGSFSDWYIFEKIIK